MMDLSEKYGPNKPFKDEQLINEIVTMTYPEIREFFNKYVIGAKDIPYDEFMDVIGWDYLATEQKTGYHFGNFGLGFDDSVNKFVFLNVGDNTLGIEEGDALISINETMIEEGNVRALITKHLLSSQEESEVNVTIERAGKIQKLKGKPNLAISTSKDVIKGQKNPSQKQLKYRGVFMNGLRK